MEITAIRRSSQWSAEAREKVRALWIAGESASVIACKIGTTRNAIIGLVHRMGLGGMRKTTSRISGWTADRKKRHVERIKLAATKRKAAKPDRPPRPPKAPRNFDMNGSSPAERDRAVAEFAKLQAEIAARQDVIRVASIIDLEDHHCRWPIGEPTKGFCGDPKVPGSSYCACHLARSTATDNWHLRRIDNSRPAWAALEVTETVAA